MLKRCVEAVRQRNQRKSALLVEKLLATACDFVARVPIRRLTFYPDARVWDLVRDFDRNFAHNFARELQEVPEHA